MNAFKMRMFRMIRPNGTGVACHAFELVIISLILLNLAIGILDTFPLPGDADTLIAWADLCIITIFTIEYVLRLWTSDLLYPELPPWRARIRYAFTPLAVIDFISIFPFYLPILVGYPISIIRSIRVLRLFQIFKMGRYITGLASMGAVLVERRFQLVSSLVVIFLFMLMASVLMYSVEHPVQPDVFQNAFSGLWWAITTITTVGYGDIYPITAAGRVISGIIALLGVSLVAIPSGIISAGFAQQIEKKRHPQHFCPYCGKRLD